MTTRLEHQSFANPVKISQEMLPLLAHVPPFQNRAASCDDPHRVSTSMRINTKKCLCHDRFLFHPRIVEETPDTERVLFLQLCRKQCIREILETHRPNKPLHSIGTNGCESGIGRSRERTAMVHRWTNLHSGRYTIDDDSAYPV